MKKKVLMVITILFLTGSSMFINTPEALSHDISLSFGINMITPAPAVVVARPPDLHVIPGTPVYYVPEIHRQLYFYSGSWYRLYDGYWFRASFHNGPWVYLSPSSVPVVFLDISPRYYRIPPREQYRVRQDPARHWKHVEYKRYENRDKRYDEPRGRGFDGRKDWKHDRPKKRRD